jgi:excinuclease ABC subunit B
MQSTIDETNRRREKQLLYNNENNIVPTAILRSKEKIMQQTSVASYKAQTERAYVEPEKINFAADPVVQYMTKPQLLDAITKIKKQMESAAKDLDFLEAARLRDEMNAMNELLSERFGEK